MSDNPTPRKMRFSHIDCHDEDEMCAKAGCIPLEPPAPRISEEEMRRVVNELCEASDDYWREKFAAILRTLNEEKKA